LIEPLCLFFTEQRNGNRSYSRLQTRWIGLRFSAGARNYRLLQNVHIDLGVSPSLQCVPGALFVRMKRPRPGGTTHLHLVPRLRMSGSAPLFPVLFFMACTKTPLPFSD
jgi:hypothetical protein